jgi:hypothetical protein
MPRTVSQRPRSFDGLVDHRGQLHFGLLKLDTIVSNAAEIEKIVHEPHQLS